MHRMHERAARTTHGHHCITLRLASRRACHSIQDKTVIATHTVTQDATQAKVAKRLQRAAFVHAACTRCALIDKHLISDAHNSHPRKSNPHCTQRLHSSTKPTTPCTKIRTQSEPSQNPVRASSKLTALPLRYTEP